MGMKYIIELESGTHIFVLGPEGIVHIGEPDVVYGTVDGMQIGDADINAKPYTEPDLEQVRKEAYENGYKKCMSENDFDSPCVSCDKYQQRLTDAWEAARKISMSKIDGGFSWESMNNMFGTDSPSKIYKTFTASEAIDKLRAYEQEKDSEIKVGDEVTLKCGVRPAIYMQGTKGSDEIYLLFNDGSCGVHSKSEIERKTGRHFHEIATILEKMRGEQDG